MSDPNANDTNNSGNVLLTVLTKMYTHIMRTLTHTYVITCLSADLRTYVRACMQRVQEGMQAKLAVPYLEAVGLSMYANK